MVEILAELKPGRELHTNVEFYAGVVMELCGLPREMFTPTFAVARVIGWCANILEQAADSKIIRPSARYVGPPPPQPVPAALKRSSTGQARRRRGAYSSPRSRQANRGPDMTGIRSTAGCRCAGSKWRRRRSTPSGWPVSCRRWGSCCATAWTSARRPSSSVTTAPASRPWWRGIAMAFGLNAEGGSTHARHATRASESPLGTWLRVVREAGASRWGYFLRAETMHGLYTYLEANPSGGSREPRFHEMSHGESFLEVLRSRFDGPGLYVLDEPESALSFSGCLASSGVLHDLVSMGTAQVLLATHSPVVAALPGRGSSSSTTPAGTRLLGRPALVDHHRRFLSGPERYLRHVLQ